MPLLNQKSLLTALSAILAGTLLTLPARANPDHASLVHAERVKRKSENVNQLIQREADQLSSAELAAIDQLLNRIRATILRNDDGGGAPRPRPRPPRPHDAYMIRAKVGSMDVSFDGFGLQALLDQCNAHMATTDVTVYSIEIGDETLRANWPGFTDQATCAILAANAELLSGHFELTLQAKIGTIPINIQTGSRIEQSEAIDLLIPKLVGDTQIYSLTINGETIRRSWPGFNIRAIQALLKWNSQVPHGRMIATGKISGLPFIFSGVLPSQIETECHQFVDEVIQDTVVYALEVNGQARRTNWPGFKKSEICMTVKTLAQSR